jgi:hypothetical protein
MSYKVALRQARRAVSLDETVSRHATRRIHCVSITVISSGKSERLELRRQLTNSGGGKVGCLLKLIGDGLDHGRSCEANDEGCHAALAPRQQSHGASYYHKNQDSETESSRACCAHLSQSDHVNRGEFADERRQRAKRTVYKSRSTAQIRGDRGGSSFGFLLNSRRQCFSDQLGHKFVGFFGQFDVLLLCELHDCRLCLYDFGSPLYPRQLTALRKDIRYCLPQKRQISKNRDKDDNHQHCRW